MKDRKNDFGERKKMVNIIFLHMRIVASAAERIYRRQT